MNRDNNSIDELLVKYLLHEADAQEHLTLMKWREAKAENEQYFTDFRLIWEESKKLQSTIAVDETAAWERLQIRLNKDQAPAAAPRRVNLMMRNLMRVAAVLVLCVGGYFLYEQQANKMITVYSEAAIRKETLPDGSVVTLNRHASITYPKRFTGGSRGITLSGEAFFNITPDKTKPFIIEANGVSVKVVGTSFNVKTGADKTEVIVETGIVEVIKKEYSVRLSPAEKATVTATAAAPVKDVAKDALYNYYRTNEFVCNNTPLWRLVEVLNEAYDARIVIGNDNIRELPLTATFKNENLNDILSIIIETLDVTAERRGTDIVLQ
ncbi:MAG TPA: FecR domain-containing protein [Chitinophagaceae bacterium]|nr:FecR domain-containing protein [Chitinophagaceae bacterium]